MHVEYNNQPPPPVPGYPPPHIPPFDHSQPLTQPLLAAHDHAAPAISVVRNPTQTERDLRRTRRSARAYDPTRGQRTSHQPREGGRGRTRGSPNYKHREVEFLLDLVEEELPITSKGWRVVGSRFRDWAFISQNPSRTDRSLELKFKQVCFASVDGVCCYPSIFPQLVKTKKPTGDAICPPHIDRAHKINHKLQSKVACRDLEDQDIIEVDENDSDTSNDKMSDSDDNPEDTDRDSPPPAPRVRTMRVEAPLLSQESARQPSSKGVDILEKISKTFDPEVQSRREADRASSMLQTQQLILFQSQIRDLNSTILTLCNQLDDSERRRINTTRRADRLQNQIDINSAFTRAHLYRSTAHVPRYTSPISISSTPDGDRQFEASFRDGGSCSWFGNADRFNHDDDVVEVTRVPWSPPPSTPAQSPPRSTYETESEI